ncbi:MAG: TonB family protein [Chitinispirillia bacterium]|jgi:TonB family protein
MKITEKYTESKSMYEYLFSFLFPVTVAVFICFGLYLNSIEPQPVRIKKVVSKIKTQFILPKPRKKTEKEIPQKKPEEVKKETVREEKPVDLTNKPEMNEKQDDIVKEVKKTKKKVRRIYGLKKVYSRGLGTGGSMSDAVAGKLGNTLNRGFDTTTATEEEIKGRVVSTTTVTRAPSFKKRIKPVYTDEMIKNRVQGTVKVKVLVDVDGRVKKATALNDLGFEAARRAIAACLNMEFFPAMRGENPVAVWIIIPIKFVLLG